MIRTPDLNLLNGFPVLAIGVGMALMLVLVLRHAWANSRKLDLTLATGLIALAGGACWLLSPTFQSLGNLNNPIF